MRTKEYKIKLISPGFLGDAVQKGQWRIPPFKALLRQWWRVAMASELKYNLNKIRDLEGELFGQVGKNLDSNSVATRSQVRLHFGGSTGWHYGNQEGVRPMDAGPDYSYAWFGLINRGGGQQDRTAIRADNATESVCTLHLACPEEASDVLDRVMGLIGHFGQIGSRCRGGWGSLHIESGDSVSLKELQQVALPLGECLQQRWPVGLLRNDQGVVLLWESNKSWRKWHEVMQQVAVKRKEVRRSLRSVDERDLRQTLGFAGSGRMPSPLRWKLYPKDGQIAFRVFAMPYCPADDCGFGLNPAQHAQAWRIIVEQLNTMNGLCPVFHK